MWVNPGVREPEEAVQSSPFTCADAVIGELATNV
jgi:hypothetical protein